MPHPRWIISGIIAAMFVANTAFANDAPASQPIVTLRCEEMHHHISQGLLILNNDGPVQQLYVFTNVSDKPLLLGHPVTDPGATAGWSSTLNPGQWSVIAMDKDKFALSCQLNQAGNTPVNCGKVLSICDMPQASFPRINLGSYWVSENQPFATLVTEIRKIGIQLPDNLPGQPANDKTPVASN